jgi:hypothetical protein
LDRAKAATKLPSQLCVGPGEENKIKIFFGWKCKPVSFRHNKNYDGRKIIMTEIVLYLFIFALFI